VEDALQHPTWKMGAKITIDSATLMNKGLEVIEARWLFDVAPDQVQIVVHPQSIVHSMVEYIDGSVIAQLGVADMVCDPLCAHLSRATATPAARLDLARVGQLTFHEPDVDKFPCLRLARAALEAGSAPPVVLNAANGDRGWPRFSTGAWLHRDRRAHRGGARWFAGRRAGIDRGLRRGRRRHRRAVRHAIDGPSRSAAS